VSPSQAASPTALVVGPSPAKEAPMHMRTRKRFRLDSVSVSMCLKGRPPAPEAEPAPEPAASPLSSRRAEEAVPAEGGAG